MQKSISFLMTFPSGSAERKRVRFKGWAMLAALSAVPIAVHFTHLKLSRNFHPVVVGKVYRAGQPDGPDIQRMSDSYGIKSILNLRGANPGKGWYEQEISASEQAGIQHIDFAMSSTKELSVAEASELIKIMKHAPKPLLIHCEAGVNRTGLASALYLATIGDKKPHEAELQLSLIYGYLPVWLMERYAMIHSYQQISPFFSEL